MNRCKMCKKKVGLVPFSCKCDLKYLCSSYRHPQYHNCSFDFKKEATYIIIN